MKTYLITGVIITLFLGLSCATQRKCFEKFPPMETKDSIYTETVKEVPVYLPGDSIEIWVPIDCPDQDVAFVENNRLKQQIIILNGRLKSNTVVKPDTVFVPVIETKTVIKLDLNQKENLFEVMLDSAIMEAYHWKTEYEKITQVIKERYVPKIYKQALSICIFIFVAFAGWLAMKFIKR